MKSYCFALTLLIGGLLLTPTAKADPQYGMDQGYNNSINSQAQQGTQAGPQASFAATGNKSGNTTEGNAWQDTVYIDNQQARQGTLQAPKGPSGGGSTFKGNLGQFIKGASSVGVLPTCQMGLNALHGYNGPACGTAGSGGFSGGGGGSGGGYSGLPSTATSTVDMNIVGQ